MRYYNTTSIEKQNFHHLVLDIAWFGLALAASTRFLSVYAIRLGASPIELGWLTAMPALMLLIATTLASWWMHRYSSSAHAVWWPTLVYRFAFVLPIFAPLLPPEWRPWWLILSISLPAIPQGISSIIFVVMMREAIDDSEMTALISRRQLAMNITIGIGAAAFGVWLEVAPFPLNYQVMFLAAFGFAMGSQWHVTKIRVATAVLPAGQSLKATHENPWKSRTFQVVIMAAIIMYVAFFAIVPVVPLHLVDGLGATEGFMALYGMLELLAGATISTVSSRIVGRLGNRVTIALSMVGTATAALIIAIAPNLEITLLAAAISGASWTLGNIGLFGFFVENTPRNDPEAYTRVYHQVLFLSMFIGPMLGSGLANLGVSLFSVLIVGACMRLAAAMVIQPDLVLTSVRSRLAQGFRH